MHIIVHSSAYPNILEQILSSDGDPLISRKRILIHISGGLDSILIFSKHFLFILKISKTYVFFLRMSGEYLKKYRQGSFISTDPWKWILKTDPCPFLVKYSLDVLKKKTKLLYFNTNKKYLMKINIESSPLEIWIRIHLLEINGSPSLILSIYHLFHLITIYLSLDLTQIHPLHPECQPLKEGW